jgi:hypothetical protein
LVYPVLTHSASLNNERFCRAQFPRHIFVPALERSTSHVGACIPVTIRWVEVQLCLVSVNRLVISSAPTKQRSVACDKRYWRKLYTLEALSGYNGPPPPPTLSWSNIYSWLTISIYLRYSWSVVLKFQPDVIQSRTSCYLSRSGILTSWMLMQTILLHWVFIWQFVSDSGQHVYFVLSFPVGKFTIPVRFLCRRRGVWPCCDCFVPDTSYCLVAHGCSTWLSCQSMRNHDVYRSLNTCATMWIVGCSEVMR